MRQPPDSFFFDYGLPVVLRIPSQRFRCSFRPRTRGRRVRGLTHPGSPRRVFSRGATKRGQTQITTGPDAVYCRVARRVQNRNINRALNEASRGASAPRTVRTGSRASADGFRIGLSFVRCPGFFVRHVRRRNEPRIRGVVDFKRPAVRIRRRKSPGADAPRLASSFLCFVVRWTFDAIKSTG